MKTIGALLLAHVCLWAQATPAILEDWACGYGSSASPYVDGASVHTTLITCTSAHGYPSGTFVSILGATGSWASLNTSKSIGIMQVISPTGTTLQVIDTNYAETGEYLIGSEYVTVSALGTHSMTLSARGVASTPASHYPEDVIVGPDTRLALSLTVYAGDVGFGKPVMDSALGAKSSGIARAMTEAGTVMTWNGVTMTWLP